MSWTLKESEKRPLGERQKVKEIGTSGRFEISPPKDAGKCKEIEIFADTETYYLTDGVKPWEIIGKPNFEAQLAKMAVKCMLLVWKYGHQTNVLYLNEDNELEMINQFLSNLSYIYNVERRTPTLYFHNSSYDLTVLANLFKTLDPDMEFYFLCQRKNRGFLEGCMQSPKYNFYCKFGDTLKYDGTLSIAKAGDMFGMPKLGGFPYGMCDPELVGTNVDDVVVRYTDIHTGKKGEYPLKKAIDYAERDVEIMMALHHGRCRSNEELNSLMIENYDEGPKWRKNQFRNKIGTQGGHTKRICDEHLKNNDCDIIDGVFRYDLAIHYAPGDLQAIYQRVINSNCGGFTTYNKHISKYDCKELNKTIKTFDVNSMYPYIMTGDLPWGELMSEKPVDGLPYTTGHCVRISSCKWKGKLSCLMNQGFAEKKTQNTPFLVEKEYWDFVCENSDIEYTLEHTYYQYNTRIFEPLINKYYGKRLEYKDLKEKAPKGSADYELYDTVEHGLKVLLNSIYGKMCEKGYHVNTVYYDLKYEIYQNPWKKYPCILTGSFITYRARLKLLSTILKTLEAGHDFLYADTDSITLGCDKDADLTTIFGEKTKKLGGGKDEGTYDLYLNIFKKKKYFLVNRETKEFKLALSGIPRKVQKILDHQLEINFEKTLEDIKKIFDPSENYRFLQCKPNASLNFLDQMIIVNVDFDINGGELDPTGTIEFTEDDYIMKELKKN